MCNLAPNQFGQKKCPRAFLMGSGHLNACKGLGRFFTPAEASGIYIYIYIHILNAMPISYVYI